MVLVCCLIFLLMVVQKSATDKTDFNFVQKDYKIKFEHADVDELNKNYVHYFNITTFKYNRTTTAFNVTFKFKIDLGPNSQIQVQSFKFMSNEYRQFPLRFEIGMCVIFEQNVAGFGNLTKCQYCKQCTFGKNKEYGVYNFTPDESKFPPFIPNGRYMSEMRALYQSREIFLIRAYAEVYRPFGWKNVEAV